MKKPIEKLEIDFSQADLGGIQIILIELANKIDELTDRVNELYDNQK